MPAQSKPTAAPRLVHALTYTDPFGLCPPKESCVLLALLRESGKSSMRIATFAPGQGLRIGGYDVTAKRETTVDLTQSKKTGNALILAVGQAQVKDAIPVLKADVDISSAAYDVGTKEWEAHGTTSALGSLGPSVHVKGNEEGPTGACFIICFPLNRKPDPNKSQEGAVP